MNESWKKLHDNYKSQDWINRPSIFATQAINLFPSSGKLLELGAGLGQDSIFFAKNGYVVTSTDINIAELTNQLLTEAISVQNSIDTMELDLINKIPFGSNSFDVVYAHLSLHYFNQDSTVSIFNEIERVLMPGGILAFFTNSTNDPEYGIGEEIEKDYFNVNNVAKRYLTVDTAKRFAINFIPIVADNCGETYKDSAKGVHNLIRFIGRKK